MGYMTFVKRIVANLFKPPVTSPYPSAAADAASYRPRTHCQSMGKVYSLRRL